MRWLLVLLAGCGFRINAGQDAGTVGDADTDGDAMTIIDEAPPNCDAPVTWAAGLTPTQTLHVDPMAAPGGDGSQASPFMTIAAAAAIATPGTRILLAPRSYQAVTLMDLRGTATAPIWIEGPATSPRASFTGANGIRLVRPQYVVVQHLDFVAITGDGIHGSDGGLAMFGMAHHLAIADIATSSVNTPVKLEGVEDVSIYDSTFATGARGIYLVGVHRAVVARVTMTQLTMTSFQAAGGSTDIVLRQSRISLAGTRALWLGGNQAEADFRPALAAANNYEARDVKVFNNFIDGHEAAIVCANCTDAFIANNRITGDLTYVLRVMNEHPGGIAGKTFTPPGTLRIFGNAIEVTTNPFGTRMESNTTCATCVYSHNLWLEIDDPPDSTPPLPVPETNGIYGMPSGYDAQGRLCAGGAAIGTGPTLAEVNGTFVGACRAMPRSIGPSDPDGGC